MKIAKNEAKGFVHAGIRGWEYSSDGFTAMSCARITVSEGTAG